jgi:DNA-binding winged helix-turn-helix (wHTH) protein/TolB-like protein/tetratricopeptide (TPR) repeat protein
MNIPARTCYEFDGFRLDVIKKRLWRGDAEVHLTPKALEILLLLVQKRGGLVERDEILDQVWQDTFIEEGNINFNISVLRKALQENSEDKRSFIQTVPKKGYRFVADVKEITDHPAVDKVADGSHADRPGMISSSSNAVRWHFLGIILLGVFFLTSFAVFWEATGESAFSPVPVNKRKIRSIAILPPHPITMAETDEMRLLSLGLTDSLISRLGSLNKFSLRPISSVMNADPDPYTSGRALGVDAVLEGTLIKVGDRLRINYRFLDVRDGAQIWTGTFDVVENDIWGTQESVAVRVAESLVRSLTSDERNQLSRRPTEDAEAFRHYVRGRYLWNKRTPDALKESVAEFQAAIERDPSFALAYVGMAESYVIFPDYAVAPPADAFPRATAAINKALKINPEIWSARITLAYLMYSFDWNYAEAEHEFRGIVARNPGSATAHQWYGEMLTVLKRFDDAEKALRAAAEIDPLVPITRSEVGVMLYYSRRFDDALRHFLQLKEEFPEFPTSYLFLAWTYEQQGLFEEAFNEELVYWRMQGLDAELIADLKRIYDARGRETYLRHLGSALEKEIGDSDFPKYRIVHLFARLRDREKTLEWLEKCVNSRAANIMKVNVDPNFDFLRNDDTFIALLGKMDLH